MQFNFTSLYFSNMGNIVDTHHVFLARDLHLRHVFTVNFVSKNHNNNKSNKRKDLFYYPEALKR